VGLNVRSWRGRVHFGAQNLSSQEKKVSSHRVFVFKGLQNIRILQLPHGKGSMGGGDRPDLHILTLGFGYPPRSFSVNRRKKTFRHRDWRLESIHHSKRAQSRGAFPLQKRQKKKKGGGQSFKGPKQRGLMSGR